MIAVLSTLLMPSDALACGGFFCNRDPVNQASEDIVFKVDKQTNTTTMHVQIAYQGSAEEFAWIVPVGAVPELRLSTDTMFEELKRRTAPTFNLEAIAVGDCELHPYNYYYDYAFSPTPPVADSGSSAESGVAVIAEKTVGPFETVVLQAQTATALLDWLQANQFDLPDELNSVLKPYVASDSYFVALRLGKNNDVGSLQPLAMTYPGTAMSVPIRLTAIAANDDMRMQAYLLGDSRAVPESYLHVVVNDLVVDWFNFGFNYPAAITAAADEAGGQAFATDFSGDAAIMDESLFREDQFDTGTLAYAADPASFFDQLESQGFRGSSLLLELFRTFVPMPQELVDQGLDETNFYNCLRCYEEYIVGMPFDAPAFAQAIEERIVQPLAEAQAMFDDTKHLTRLTSSVSPVEMTVDPTFVFNRDMTQNVSREREAELEYYCEDGLETSELQRRLVLADGRAYRLPPQSWFWENNTTEYEYLSGLMDDFALIVEETSAEGQPNPIYNGSKRAFDAANAHNAGFDDLLNAAACGGCSSTGPLSASFGVAGLAGLVLLRRLRS
ncbi:MAG: DUF2330 domain-containing protein [Myxococcota bacterium]